MRFPLWSGQCQSGKNSLIIVLEWALVCVYECAQRKMNEIFIHEGNRKLPGWRRLCVLFDVNGEHIVSGLNGILRLQAEAVMDMASYLCPAGKQSQI